MLMAQAAVTAGVCPRDLSFKGTLQTLVVFAASGWACPERRNDLYAAVLRAVATRRLSNRVEPQAMKRRPNKQVYLTKPRSVAKARLFNTTSLLWKCHSGLTLGQADWPWPGPCPQGPFSNAIRVKCPPQHADKSEEKKRVAGIEPA